MRLLKSNAAALIDDFAWALSWMMAAKRME